MLKMETDRRLNRIEEKIDKLADLVILIARAEERLIGLEADKLITHASIDEIEDRIVAVEKCVGLNTRTVDSMHKVVWIMLSAIITAFVAYILSWSPPV
jgi:uncharacterized coiled-coil protein SlyX